jgi:hypothetical protein
VTLGGFNSSDYSFDASTVAALLRPAAAASSRLCFSPLALGLRSGTRSITDSTPGAVIHYERLRLRPLDRQMRRRSLNSAANVQAIATATASSVASLQIANCRRELHDHANANRGRDGFIKAITDEPHHVISQRQVIEVDGAEIE